MSIAFGKRRAEWVRVPEGPPPLAPAELACFEATDLFYRSLCALLYNYVPTSGHPGGSISSGRFVAGLLFDAMDYELARPDREDADIISYAAGHKAMGLYSMWALRDELLALEVQRSRYEEVLRENRRLRDLLAFAQRIELDGVVAPVLANQSLAAQRTILIGRGGDDGVQLDAPALCPDGVVGRVIAVAATLAFALTACALGLCKCGISAPGWQVGLSLTPMDCASSG